MDNTPVVIDNITIKQDAQGRYCLNDLHRAAGGEGRHRPSLWIANQQAMSLARELEAENPASKAVEVKRGRGITGTYVVRELVYAYATWISEKFYLKVIRFFDRGMTQGVAIADHAAEDLLKNPLKYLEVLLSQAKELQARNLIAAPKAAVFDSVVADRRVSLENSGATGTRHPRMGDLIQPSATP